MLGKFKPFPDFILPLLTHSIIQGLGTFVILYPNKHALLFSLLEIPIHFVIDRVKADKNLLGRWPVESPYFWYTLGFDQTLHYLTYAVFCANL
jgi:hypothetical protein